MAMIGLSCFLLMLPVGCTITSNIIIDDIGEIPDPLIEKFPLAIGVYYSDEFRSFKTDLTDGSPDITINFHIEVGEANVAFFEYMLPRTFNSIRLLYDYPDSKKNHEYIDLIIVPKILNYHYGIYGIVIIEYEICSYLPNGEQITSWRIKATPDPQKSFYGFGHQNACQGITKEAFRYLATIFFTGFCEQTKFKENFQNLCEP